MNLVTEPWIPVLNTQGTTEHASLGDVLCRGTQFRDLAVRPHERVALMRLLLCIAHAALDGPKPEDWRRVPELLPQKAREYLETWQDSFDLFHPAKPFLQIAGLQAPAPKTKHKKTTAPANDTPNDAADDAAADGPSAKVSKLDFALATGNNTTLFDHEGTRTKRPIPPKRIALNILTFQCFALGGGKSSPVFPGQTTPKNFSDSVCSSSSMLHTFWRGSTLLETLHRNLCHTKTILQRYAETDLSDIWGRPVWERMPSNLDDAHAIHNATSTYLGRLVPLSRLILLRQDCATMLLGAGPVYPNYNSEKNPFVEEPTATLVLRDKDKKQTRVLLGVDPHKALWRELHALVAHRNTENVGGFWAAGHSLPDAAHDVLVVGMERDKAEVNDILESVYHVPAALCGESRAGREEYAQGVAYAETVGQRLGWAVDRYRQAVEGGRDKRSKGTGPKKDTLLKVLQQKTLTHYWTAAEQNLPLLFACVEALGTDACLPAQEAWRKALRAAAHKAYRLACAPQSPRQFKAFAKGLGALSKAPDGANNDTSPTAHEEAQP